LGLLSKTFSQTIYAFDFLGFVRLLMVNFSFTSWAIFSLEIFDHQILSRANFGKLSNWFSVRIMHVSTFSWTISQMLNSNRSVFHLGRSKRINYL